MLSAPANARFVVQKMMMHDHYRIYVNNLPIAELQRFVGIIASAVPPNAML
jgi:hypothetical protein